MSTEQLNLLISELIYQKKVNSQADFSRKLGYKGRSYVSDMVNGKKPANIDNDVLKAFPNVNPDWLQTGKGDVLLGKRTQLREPLVGTMYEPPSEDYNRDWKGKYFTSLEENNKVLQKAVDSQAEAISTLSKVALNSGRFQKAVDLNTLMINSLQEFVTTRFSEVEQREISDVGEELGNVVLRQAKEQKTGNEKRKGTVRS